MLSRLVQVKNNSMGGTAFECKEMCG